MHKKLFGLISIMAFCALLSGFASAFVVDAPRSILILDSPRDFWITVKNDSPIEQDLEVRVFSPTNTNLPDVPSSIRGNSEARFLLTMYPDKDLVNQTYESTLIIELGSEKVIKTINLAFKKAQEQLPEKPVPKPVVDVNGFSSSISSGFASLAVIGSENALNLALVFIAAILLIAFIARFIRRIQ